MPRDPLRVPSYRHQKSRGLAVVRLDGKDHYLGKFGSAESKQKYQRLIGEWMARSVDVAHTRPGSDPPSGRTIDQVIVAFWDHATHHYRKPTGKPSEELGNLKVALRPLRKLYGSTQASEFGPLALRAVRDEMIRSGLARTSVNARINRIRRVFRWAASVELVPVSVVQSIETVAGLKKGRTEARESEPVGPVAVEDVERTLPFVSGPVAGLVRLQLLTGMRPGEACAMRGCDLAPGEGVWMYRPASHKTEWRGKSREIAIGPKAIEIVREFEKADADAYLFDPREAVAEHHSRRSAERKSRPTPSERSKRAEKPGSGHRRRYSRASYRNAILRACERAGVTPWSPNQLRHATATSIRAKYGLEAAQVILGHSKADVTQVYAERDRARAVEIMREIG
jgi:integrase